MKKVETLLTNIFEDRDVTDSRIDGFAIVTVQKIQAANDAGQYDHIIEKINSAQEPFHTKIVDLDADSALSKGKTITREGVIADFLDFVRLEQGTIRKKYIANEESYLEFYPNQLKDYNAISKITATILIKRYSDAATAHSADFDSDFVTAANAFPTTYSTALDKQSAVLGKQSTDRTNMDTLRPDLNSALFQALHFIAFYTNGNVVAAKGMMDLSTLVSHPRTTILHKSGVVNPETTINIHSENYDITWVVKIKNIGSTEMNICLAPTETTACSAIGGVLKAGRTKTFVIVSLGTIGNQFLNLTNTSLHDIGSYEVEIFRQ